MVNHTLKSTEMQIVVTILLTLVALIIIIVHTDDVTVESDVSEIFC